MPEYDQWLQACYERASAYNHQLITPLDSSEVFAIAKSIAKWINGKLTEYSFADYVKRTHSLAIQSLKGKKMAR